MKRSLFLAILAMSSIARADDWNQCQAAARKLISKGRSCGVNMSRYTPKSICDDLKTEMSAEQSVRRLEVQSADCEHVRAAVAGDRV
jgi:hypothetical protein